MFLKFHSNSHKHFVEVQKFDKDRGGYKGGHDYDNLIYHVEDITHNKAVKILKINNSHIEGIYEIHYTVPILDYKGNYISQKWRNNIYIKTVFDPKIINYSLIKKWAVIALQTPKVIVLPNQIYIKGVAPNGLKFEGWLDKNRTIKSYYPVLKYTI